MKITHARSFILLVMMMTPAMAFASDPSGLMTFFSIVFQVVLMLVNIPLLAFYRLRFTWVALSLFTPIWLATTLIGFIDRGRGGWSGQNTLCTALGVIFCALNSHASFKGWRRGRQGPLPTAKFSPPNTVGSPGKQKNWYRNLLFAVAIAGLLVFALAQSGEFHLEDWSWLKPLVQRYALTTFVACLELAVLLPAGLRKAFAPQSKSSVAWIGVGAIAAIPLAAWVDDPGFSNMGLSDQASSALTTVAILSVLLSYSFIFVCHLFFLGGPYRVGARIDIKDKANNPWLLYCGTACLILWIVDFALGRLHVAVSGLASYFFFSLMAGRASALSADREENGHSP